jgi:hypothetical protein
MYITYYGQTTCTLLLGIGKGRVGFGFLDGKWEWDENE